METNSSQLVIWRFCVFWAVNLSSRASAYHLAEGDWCWCTVGWHRYPLSLEEGQRSDRVLWRRIIDTTTLHYGHTTEEEPGLTVTVTYAELLSFFLGILPHIRGFITGLRPQIPLICPRLYNVSDALLTMLWLSCCIHGLRCQHSVSWDCSGCLCLWVKYIVVLWWQCK